MITDYKKYVNNIETLRKKLMRTKKELKINLEQDLKNELSKYLKQDAENSNIFLLEDDYGVMINVPDFTYSDDSKNYYATIYTIYKINGKFRKSNYEQYKVNNDVSIEDFVKNFVEDLKKSNITRKQNKEKRELKKSMNKYNL